ncbi:PucR family transcriptional regulator [Arthrobacter crystallopoietes]|uniref:PucR family transcriptional regulator n=1 Tax=Crystallibacter crystallopoietes TaxID=37928 RepID=UPI00111154DA|nr:PucR family transcriptional regulator [Arthrobacter crystallopoietes]
MRHSAPSAGGGEDGRPVRAGADLFSGSTAGAFAAVSLERFLDRLPDTLTVVHDGRPATAEPALVRWVEPSELEDPAPYLLEGEFVLTAGLPFLDEGGTPEAVDRYIERLVQAKVCALGFGISPYFSDVPQALAEACRKHSLTLVAIPEEVPFAALGLEFARLLEAENLRVLRLLSEANRQLMRAVLTPRPEAELLEALVRNVPVWAVLVGANRRVRSRAVPAQLQGGLPEAAELDPMLARLFAGSGPRVELESFDAPGARRVVGYPLRSTRDANLGALVVGAANPLEPVEKNIVETAVGLLEALLRQRTVGSLAPSQLATTLLLHPEITTAGSRCSQAVGRLVAQSVSAPRHAELRVVQGFRAGGPALEPAEKAGASHGTAGEDPVRGLLQWRRIFDTKLVESTDYGFAAITRLRVDDAVVAEVEKLGWHVVISDTAELPELPEAYRRVTSLRQQAQVAGRSVRADQVEFSVTGLLGPEAGAMLFNRSFSPLRQLEPERASALLAVLRAWLESNGSWDGSAKALGLHRNSVRRQIGQLGELLGRDLADAQTRAELLIALNYSPPNLLTGPE